MTAKQGVIEYRGRERLVDDANAASEAWLAGEEYTGASRPLEVAAWPISDPLTIFEAAIAYVGGHPHHPYCPVPARDDPSADRRQHADFHGVGPEIGRSKGEQAYVARDVLNELTRRVISGVIAPVLRADLGDGEPDQLYTQIPLAALLALTRERGDAAEPIRSLADAEPSRDWRSIALAHRGPWARHPLVEAEAQSRAEARRPSSKAALREADLCWALEQMADERGLKWPAKNIAALRRKLR